MENIQINQRAEDVFQPLSEEQKEYKRMQRADRYNNKSTLKMLCLRTIIKDIPSYWSKNKSEDGTSPFEYLTDDILLNEILIEYKKTYKYSGFFKYADLFITSNLREIQIQSKPRYPDLQLCFDTSSSILLESIKLKCQNNLRELSINHCKTDKFILYEALISLKNLTVLKLIKTTCDDVTMNIISDGMNSLIELHVSECKVTDAGVLRLCKSNYQQLRYLTLDCDDITEVGIFQILNTYPELLTLKHIYFDRILLAWINRNPGKKTKLTSLFLNIHKTQPNSATPFFEICPDLKYLTVAFYDRYAEGKVVQTGDNLPFPSCCISNLKMIKSLTLQHVNPWFSSDTITFVSLKETAVDLIDLFIKLPNIKHLDLFGCKIVCTQNQILPLDNDLIFSKIKTLVLNLRDTSNKRNDTLYINLLSKFINSKNLESLSLINPHQDHIKSLKPVFSQDTYFKNLTINFFDSRAIEGIIHKNDKIESITVTERRFKFFGPRDYKVLNDCIQSMINGKTKSLRDIPEYVPIINRYDSLINRYYEL